MIEQFEAVRYKGLRDFCVGPLERVNLITGPNGVGKTSLAEALWLFHGRYNPSILWNLHLQRKATLGPSPIPSLGGGSVALRGCENGTNCEVRFEFSEVTQSSGRPTNETRHQDVIADGEGLGEAADFPQRGFDPLNRLQLLGRVRAEYAPDTLVFESSAISGPSGVGLVKPPLHPERPSGVILTRDAPFPIAPDTIERFSNVVAEGEKQRLLHILRLMQPCINSLEILTSQGVPSLWAETETAGMLPLEAVGGGVVRLLSLLVNFFTARGGLIIIDEIENGIHHWALPELWRQIRVLSEELDVQVVATTHSFECIQAAVMTEDSNTSPPPDFVLLRMYQKEGVPHCLTYAGEKLMAALDMGFEIR